MSSSTAGQYKAIPPLQRIHNFWDCGGWPGADGKVMKRGQLFRCGTLAYATADDREALKKLGLRTICDLRSHRERGRNPDRLPDIPDLQYIPLPIKSRPRLGRLLLTWLTGGDSGDVMQRIYRAFVTDFSQQFAKLMHLLVDPANLPLLIHCTAGKDRTGYACALIQLALDVPFEHVMGTYLRSNEQLRPFREEMRHKLRYLPPLGLSLEKLSPFFEVRSVYLETALAEARSVHGTIAAYMQQGLHMSCARKRQLRANLLAAS
jgi:protein-tyrosine phosphatase